MNYYDGLTDFIFVEDKPQEADIIFVPGGSYPEAAKQAARLYREGYAPLVLPSGKYSITKGYFVRPEAGPKDLPEGRSIEEFETECDYLCAVLEAAGVPREALLREKEAEFTWQNAIFSRRITDQAGLQIRKAILCCQAFHARRSLMYYQREFPEAEFFVCPAVTRSISRDGWQTTKEGIAVVLGEVERCGRQFRGLLEADAGICDREQEERI